MTSNQKIIDEARKYQYQIIKDFGKDPYGLDSHLPEAEKWARKLIKEFPDAEADAILLAVWLHDIGHYSGDPNVDHALKSEQLAKEFLKGKADENLINKVLGIIRSHRNKDVRPETLEEKLFACADSASHMTDYVYLNILRDGRFVYADAKMKRDFRDVGLIPEVKKDLEPLFKAWENFAEEYKRLGIVKIKKSTADKV